MSNMKKLIKGELGNKKLSLLSAHDGNLVPLLIFFNMTSSDCLEKKWKN